MGEGSAPPYEVTRADVCERMGWTFAEYDATPAKDLLGMFDYWKIRKSLESPGKTAK